MVQTRVNGERVQYCDKDSIPRPDRPLRDCDREDPTVTVVHGKLDASRCSLVEVAGQTGLEENPVGAAAGFSILSKDSFRNTRYVRRVRAQAIGLAICSLSGQVRRNLCMNISFLPVQALRLLSTLCRVPTVFSTIEAVIVERNTPLIDQGVSPATKGWG